MHNMHTCTEFYVCESSKHPRMYVHHLVVWIAAHIRIRASEWGCVQAKYTWALSGTPIQNHVTELFSYFRFLQYHPFDTQAFFQLYIRNVEEAPNPEHALERLREMVKPVMLRRTKGSTFDGGPVLVLLSK